jgi:hypothetical protein
VWPFGVAGKTACAQHEVTLVGDGDADLDAEFVFFMGLALGNAFDFRRMEAVEFIFVMPLLAQGTLAFRQGLLKHGLYVGRLQRKLPFDVRCTRPTNVFNCLSTLRLHFMCLAWW